MANYTENMTFSNLLSIFNKYLKIEKQLLKISIVNEENVTSFIENINLSTLEEKDINTLQGIIFNKLDPNTFDNEVPFDEVEYCWIIGKEMFNRCTEEINKRKRVSDNTLVRTNASH